MRHGLAGEPGISCTLSVALVVEFRQYDGAAWKATSWLLLCRDELCRMMAVVRVVYARRHCHLNHQGFLEKTTAVLHILSTYVPVRPVHVHARDGLCRPSYPTKGQRVWKSRASFGLASRMAYQPRTGVEERLPASG